MRPDVTDPNLDKNDKAWSVKMPTTAMEFNVEPFLEWLENANLAG